MAIHESGEMYLETIYILTREKGCVHAVDVGAYMGYSKPSVSRGVKNLKRDGYLKVDDDGCLLLTDSGREIAETIYERHVILGDVLKELGVDPEQAQEDACKIEHVISRESFDAIKKHRLKHKNQK